MEQPQQQSRLQLPLQQQQDLAKPPNGPWEAALKRPVTNKALLENLNTGLLKKQGTYETCFQHSFE